MPFTFHPDPREPDARTPAHTGSARQGRGGLTWRSLAGLVLLGAMAGGAAVFMGHTSWTTAVLIAGSVVAAVIAAGKAARGGERRKVVPLCRVCGRAVEGMEPLPVDAPVKRCPECGGAMDRAQPVA